MNREKGLESEWPNDAVEDPRSVQKKVRENRAAQNRALSGAPQNIEDHMSARQLKSTQNPSMLDS